MAKVAEDVQPFLVIDALDECESKILDEIISILTRMNNENLRPPYHLERSRQAHAFTDEVYSFFRTHLLHWLEALSLLGKRPESAKYIKTLQLLFVSQLLEFQGLLKSYFGLTSNLQVE
ncbi:hypothetical protein N7493_001243 [Penicillium malachiteum]|uniref:Uncharacterized protein n=1 Tax=Penicillium malachiteum TaxID=1324776 RepID=A0AAD6HTV8_9EURO|nr:hypothetical protein N7493_001243 [Penicillium malachiteum]